MGHLIEILFWGYFLSYIGLGLYQPASALYRLATNPIKDVRYKRGLQKYLTAVTIYFLILLIVGGDSLNNNWSIIYLLGIPYIFIAWYYSFTKKWDEIFTKEKANNQLNGLHYEL